MKISDFIHLNYRSGFALNHIDGQYFLQRGFINYSFPLLIEQQINRQLINKLKWRFPITVIKTSSKIKNTYEYILKTDTYDVGGFPHSTRSTIRKSLKYCEFKQPAYEDLIKYGLQINQQTLNLQHRRDRFLTVESNWIKYVSTFISAQDLIVLGAYFENKLIGYAVVYELEGKHYFLHQHIDRNYSTYYPMNGLMYTIINRLIDKNGSVEISDGIESFNPLPSLNKFKRTMLFDRVPVTRIYIIHPALVSIIKPILFVYLGVLKRRSIRNQLVRNLVSLYWGHRLSEKILY